MHVALHSYVIHPDKPGAGSGKAHAVRRSPGTHFLQKRFYNSQKIAAVLLLKFNYFLTGLPPNWNPTLLTIWVGYNFLIVLKNQPNIMVDACAIKIILQNIMVN